MNRYLRLYVLFCFVLVSCDTDKNIKPTTDQYFLKFYGQTGDQEGVDVKQTPDGGFIIAGNSIATFGGTSDYLLIKVDAQGNQEWQKTYDFGGFGGEDRMTEVVVVTNEYVIAGTSHINNNNKIVLWRIDADGNELNSYEVEKDSTYNYTCTGLTYSSNSDNFIVVGSLDSPVGISNNGNSLFSVVSGNLSSDKPKYSGLEGTNLTHVKAYEVIDDQTQKANYLAFGYKEDANGVISMTIFQYNDQFESSNSSSSINVSNAKTVDVIPINDGQFMVLGASNKQLVSVLVPVGKNKDGVFFFGNGNVIRLADKLLANSVLANGVLANGIAQINQDEFVVSGDIQIESSTSTIATIFDTNSTGGVDWTKYFGTSSSYKAGKVVVLSDGSIIFTGTAGSESQTKVFLIKMKSNGEMN